VNKIIKRNLDINILKNKIQMSYIYSLIIFTTFVINMCLSTIFLPDAYLISDIVKYTIAVIVCGIFLAIPMYNSQLKVEAASFKERKIFNLLLDAYFIILLLFFLFLIYNIFHILLIV